MFIIQVNIGNENYKRGKNLLSTSAKKLIDDGSIQELDNIKQNKFINILFKEIDFDYTIKVDNLICNLIGKIDRVDICDDVLRVIDYKTGKELEEQICIFILGRICLKIVIRNFYFKFSCMFFFS